MLPPWSCPYLWNFHSHDQILVYYQISSSTMEILFIVYCMWRSPHMKFVYHAYSWPLYSYVFGTTTYIFWVTCWDLSLHCTDEWLVLPLGSSLIHYGMDFIMYFGHHVTLWTHTLGGICYSWFYHTWLITYWWPSLSLCRLFGPPFPILYFYVPIKSPKTPIYVCTWLLNQYPHTHANFEPIPEYIGKCVWRQKLLEFSS